MNPVVEAVELQFIKLTKQIQIEKEMCNNLNFQLTKITDNCAHIKETNDVKNSLKTSLSIGVKCAENNILSSHNSLDITSSLENELKKIMEQQNKESKRKQLMTNLWNYERQWETVKNMYKKIPLANEVLALQQFNEQMSLEVKIKTQSIKDTKLCLLSYRKIKEKRKKAQIINLINSSLKNKISAKEKFNQKEKLRLLNISNNKVKTEKLSLIGKQHNASPSTLVYRKPKIADGFAVPPLCSILGKKFKTTNLHEKPPFPIGPVSPFIVPQLMIPAFKTTPYRNVGQATSSTVNSSFPNGGNRTDEQISCNLSDGRSGATPRKRKKEDTPSCGLQANNYITTDKGLDIIKNRNTSTNHRSSTSLISKPSVNVASDGGNPTHQLMKERSYMDRTSNSLPSVKYLSQAIQQISPRYDSVSLSENATPHLEEQSSSYSSKTHKDKGTETTINSGPRGVQIAFENGKTTSISKGGIINIDNKGISKSTNVWDIFN